MVGHVDGNALAGLLSEVVQFEPTTARARCVSCGDVAVLAQAMVYRGEQGLVVRCKQCDGVLLAVVPVPGGMRLQLRGISWLEVHPSEV